MENIREKIEYNFNIGTIKLTLHNNDTVNSFIRVHVLVKVRTHIARNINLPIIDNVRFNLNYNTPIIKITSNAKYK